MPAGPLVLLILQALPYSTSSKKSQAQKSDYDGYTAYVKARENYNEKRAAYEKAKAAYEEAVAAQEKAESEFTTATANAKSLKQFYADKVAEAKTALDTAKTEYATAKDTYDKAVAAYDKAVEARKEAEAAYKKAVQETGDAEIKNATDKLATANQDLLNITTVRDNYDTYTAAYLKDLETFETNRKEIQDMANKMRNLKDTMYKEGTTTLTDEYSKAYAAYEAAYKVAGTGSDTKPEWFLKQEGNEANAKDANFKGSLIDQYKENREKVNKIEDTYIGAAAMTNPTQGSIDYMENAVSEAKTNIAKNKTTLASKVADAQKNRDAKSEALDKLNATSANLTNLKTAWDNAVKDEEEKLTAKNNAAAAAVEAANKVTAAQNKYDTAFAEQQAIKNLDDADVAELQRFGKYNTYAILGLNAYDSNGNYYADPKVSNLRSEIDVELTVLEDTLRSSQDYVAATQKAKDAKDAAADEMHKASNILTRKKAAWRLGTPSIKVTSKKGAVKVSWKKVKHASKYKLRVKKGNGSYKTYYTSKTSKTFKVKKGTKVKVKVRAQKGTKVSHYSGYKAARAK
jgi:hypothetical protein